ncbi:ubiquitin carboxyl-terminal hydrolase 42-like isoform X1 [Brachionus plicatilis]|uniref:Ubiquitin carboxyl-terminal hydrolase 42-like isoform X1 n=1 Tax=Brachionus plicatilis TaxID=10195 RepID=A0A3M7RR39_BRAPC|nr:ubiquitin carboxyl-terminal hydrolase 42-like isoform X1 [Brachionus plicatilis]
MPADADLLCQYYIASNLNPKKIRQNQSTNLNKVKSVSDTSLSSCGASTFVFSEAATTIDFVKYDKNPMDYLKQKYHLLNASKQAKQSQSLTSLNSPAGSNEKWLDFEWSKIRKNGIGLLNLGFCSLCEVERIIYDIFNSNGFAKPNSLCYNIKKISAVFGVGTQEDASEFFTTLLESMAKSIKFSLNIHSKISSQSGKKVNTILDDIFSFQFRSRILAASNWQSSCKEDFFSDQTWRVLYFLTCQACRPIFFECEQNLTK